MKLSSALKTDDFGLHFEVLSAAVRHLERDLDLLLEWLLLRLLLRERRWLRDLQSSTRRQTL